jgi:hypothetical protein
VLVFGVFFRVGVGVAKKGMGSAPAVCRCVL